MGALSKRIQAINDVTTETVTVKEWADAQSPDGITVEVRSITLDRRNAIANESRDKKQRTDTAKYYPRLLVETCYDPETGEKAFDRTDLAWLGSKSSAALDRVARIAMKLSGVVLPGEEDDDEDDELTDEEIAEKRAKEQVETAGKASYLVASSEPGSSSPSASEGPLPS